MITPNAWPANQLKVVGLSGTPSDRCATIAATGASSVGSNVATSANLPKPLTLSR